MGIIDLLVQVYLLISEYEEGEVVELYDTIEEVLEDNGKSKINSISTVDWNSVNAD